MERLENAHMKHIVDSGIRGQAQAISNFADTFQHLEGTCIAQPELAAGACSQRLGGLVEHAQPHPIAHGELQRPVVDIIVATSILLGLEQPGAYLDEESVSINKHGVYRLKLCRTRLIGKHVRRRSPIDDLERCCAEG